MVDNRNDNAREQQERTWVAKDIETEAGIHEVTVGVDNRVIKQRPGKVDLEESEDGGGCGCHSKDNGYYGVGKQRHPDTAPVEVSGGLGGRQLETLAQLLDALRLPYPEEGESTAQGDDAGDDVGELVRKEGRGQPLSQREGNANHGSCWGSFLNTADAVQDKGDEEWHDSGDEQHLQGDKCCNVLGLLGAATGNLARSGYRDANRAKSNRSGISNQNYCCRAQWLHAKGHDHGRGNGHGGAEASEGLQQTAKTEGDEDSLDANITITQ